MRDLPTPDHRVDRSGGGVLFVYHNLPLHRIGIDEVMLLNGEPYLVLGLEGFYTLANLVGVWVERLDGPQLRL